jgi:WD40 repeat protein
MSGPIIGVLAILVVVSAIFAADRSAGTAACTRLPSPVGRPAATSVAFSFGGGLILASGYSSGATQVWDLANCDIASSLDSFGAVYSVAYSPLGGLATGGASGRVLIWNLATNHVALTVGLPGPVDTLAFSPDGRVLATAGDFGVALFDAATHREVGSIPTSNAGVMSVAFSPNGRLLAIAETRGIALVNIATDAPISRVPTRTPALTVAFSPNGEGLAVGTKGGAVHVLDITNTLTRSLPGPIWQAPAAITSVAWSENGTLAAASADGVVQTFYRRRRILSFKIAGVPTGVAFSPNATWLAVASSLGGISVRPQ